MLSVGMILHKLIFFRLSYCCAAYGDRPGLYGSATASTNEYDDGKANHIDRLEREVLSYPAFKSALRLETLFTSRRRARSYFVLLETRLNVAPAAARPSCEKVLAALHLGKVRYFTSLLVTTHGCS